MHPVFLVEFASKHPAIRAVLILLLTLAAGMLLQWVRKPDRAERWAPVWVVPVVIVLAILVYVSNLPVDCRKSATDIEDSRELIVDDNGIVIRRVEGGGTLEVSWQEVSGVEFDAYSVDFYGISPIVGWYNVGYHVGHEFETVRYVSPYDEFFQNQGDYGRSFEPNRQLWRVCVAPSRSTGGLESTVTLIEGHMRCTSPFKIPIQ